MSLPKRKQPGVTIPVLSSAHPKEFRVLSAVSLLQGKELEAVLILCKPCDPQLGAPGKNSNWKLLMGSVPCPSCPQI